VNEGERTDPSHERVHGRETALSGFLPPWDFRRSRERTVEIRNRIRA
jgi:hypothetical protein